MPQPLPSEVVHVPGVPVGMRLQRDQAIALLVITKKWSLEQACNAMNTMLGRADASVEQIVRDAIG